MTVASDDDDEWPAGALACLVAVRQQPTTPLKPGLWAQHQPFVIQVTSDGWNRVTDLHTCHLGGLAGPSQTLYLDPVCHYNI
jgi:hypothetical protein